MNPSQTFLQEIQEACRLPLPVRVMDKAREAFLDYIAVTMAGAESGREKLNRYLEAAAPEAGAFTAIGVGPHYNLKEAVFLNGLNAHTLDLDDGVNQGIIHLGSPLFSVLLPLAQKQESPFEKLLEAAILGYETAFTLALSIQPGHKDRGYHATATCGILGIALALSRLLDLTAAETERALAAASVSASGTLNVLDDGSELKPFNVAKTALLGLTAVQMAQGGYEGPVDPLAGDRGFLKMMAGSSDLPLAHPLAGGSYAIEKTYTKPYAACRYCHPAIEAALRHRRNRSLDPQSIASIEVDTYAWAVYKHDHTQVKGASSAKMSIPFSVAVALLYGRADLEAYESPYLEDPALLSLASKVHLAADEALTALFPQSTAARVKVVLASGQSFCERVDQPKGEPENPLTGGEFDQRFIDLLAYAGKSEAEARALLALGRTWEGPMDPLFQRLV